MNRQKYCPTEGNISNALIDENLQFSKEKWQNLFRKAIGIKTEKELKQKFSKLFQTQGWANQLRKF